MITAGMITRGKPNEMVSVVTSLFHLSSGIGNFSFLVAVDTDDDATRIAAGELALRYPVKMLFLDPQPSIGRKWNKLLDATEEGSHFTLITDRFLCMAPDWNEILNGCCELHPNRLLWWQCDAYDGITNPIYPANTVQRPEFRTSEIFPYWFEDNWVEEIDTLAFGFPRLRVPANFHRARQGKTRMFREYAFWIEVFASRRNERLALADRLNPSPDFDRQPILNWFAKRDESWRESAPLLEELNREENLPSAAYLDLKQRAETARGEFA